MIKKFFSYLKTIIIHKFWVFYYACICGIPWRGFWHDFSKLSPSEFFCNLKYFNGKQSPIANCKEINGYSEAWFHHRGRNKHHYEYWFDNFDCGGTAVVMPYKYTIEMFCDYLAAGRAYMGKNFSFQKEYDWWVDKKTNIHAMHLVQKIFLTQMLYETAVYNKVPNRKRLKDYYNYTLRKYKNANKNR